MDLSTVKNCFDKLLDVYSSSSDAASLEGEYQRVYDAMMTLNPTQVSHLLMENELVGTVVVDTVRLEVCQQSPLSWSLASDILGRFLRTDVADVTKETLIQEIFQAIDYIINCERKHSPDLIALVCSSAVQLLHTLHMDKNNLIFMYPADAMQYVEYLPAILSIIINSGSNVALEKVEQTFKNYLRKLLEQATINVGNTIANIIDSIAASSSSSSLLSSSTNTNEVNNRIDVAELSKYVPFGNGDGIVTVLCSHRYIARFPRTLDVLLRCFASVSTYPIFRFRSTSSSSSANTNSSNDESVALYTMYFAAIESGQSKEMILLSKLLRNLLDSGDFSDTLGTITSRNTLMKLLAPMSTCYHPVTQNAAKTLLYAIMNRPPSTKTSHLERSVSIPKTVSLFDIFLTSPYVKMTDLQSFLDGLQCALEGFSDMVPDSYLRVQNCLEMLMMDINECLVLLLQKLGTISALETIYKTLIDVGEKLLLTIPDSCLAMISLDTYHRLQSFHHFKLQTASKRFQPRTATTGSEVVSRIATDYPIARAMQVQQVEYKHSTGATSTTTNNRSVNNNLHTNNNKNNLANQKRSAFDMMMDQLAEEERRSGVLESEQDAKRRKLYQQDYRPVPSVQGNNKSSAAMNFSSSSAKMPPSTANGHSNYHLNNNSSTHTAAGAMTKYLLPLTSKSQAATDTDLIDLTSESIPSARVPSQQGTRKQELVVDTRFPASYPPLPPVASASSSSSATSSYLNRKVRRQLSFVDNDDDLKNVNATNNRTKSANNRFSDKDEADFDDYASWLNRKHLKEQHLEAIKRAKEEEKMRNGDASSQKNFTLHSFLHANANTATNASATAGGGNASNKISEETRRKYEELQLQQQQQIAFPAKKLHDKQNMYSAELLTQVSVDQLCAGIVRFSLEKIMAAVNSPQSSNEKSKFNFLPIRFGSEDQYIQAFQPLLLKEFKVALGQYLVSQERGSGGRSGGDASSEGKIQTFHVVCSQLQSRGDTTMLQYPTHDSRTNNNDTNNGNNESTDRLKEALVNKDMRYYQQLKEKNGSASNTQYQDLQKDDLVMIFPRNVHLRADMTIAELVQVKPHCLGIVASAAHKRSNDSFSEANNTNNNNNNKQMVLLDMEKLSHADMSSSAFPQYWKVVPIMSLSTFLREWTALHSMRDHRLMPLAPYLLKASPVVSQAHLLTIKSELERRWQNWVEEDRFESMRKQQQGATQIDSKAINQKRLLENRQRQRQQELLDDKSLSRSGNSGDTSSSTNTANEKSMKERLEDAILQLITRDLSDIKIDKSILRHSDIVRFLRQLINTPTISSTIVTAGESLIKKWYAICKEDNAQEHIRNLKGGKVVAIPHKEDAALTEAPRTVTSRLWRCLYDRYNNSQLFAIKYVVEAFDSSQDTRVCLVQGPPGTGKTSTIIGMVSALLGRQYACGAIHPANTSDNNTTTSSPQRTTAELRRAISEDASSPRLLICAPSNAAIDEILLRLYQQGIFDPSNPQIPQDNQQPPTRIPRIVRLGDPIAENHSAENIQIIQSLTLTYQVDQALAKDPLSLERQTLLTAIREAEVQLSQLNKPDPSTNKRTANNNNNNNNNNSSTNSAQTQQESPYQATATNLQRLRIQLNRNLIALERRRGELRLQILFDAEVVGSTLSSSGKQHFLDYIIKENVLFHTTIIDEAAQTTEPASLIPLRFGCRRLVLVGDPRQLPATVLSREVEKAGLGRSLFERLEQAEHEVVMLTVQYRMHPEIRRFPSLYFYQNLLIDAPHIQQETMLLSLATHATPSSINRVVLLDVEEGEEVEEKTNEEVLPVAAAAAVQKSTMTVTTRLITDQSTLFPDASSAVVQEDANPPFSHNANKVSSSHIHQQSSVHISVRQPLAPVTLYHVGVDAHTRQGETAAGTSFVNETEARAMLQWLLLLPREVLQEENLSLAIIVPYKAQVKLLRQMLKREPRLAYLLGDVPNATFNNNNNRRNSGFNAANNTTTTINNNNSNNSNNSNSNSNNNSNSNSNPVTQGVARGRIEVNTVDGFQGREKDVVLYGTVRSKAQHSAQSSAWVHRHRPSVTQTDHRRDTDGDTVRDRDTDRGHNASISTIGFVADERRINVALTRAKKLLVLFGNVYTLVHDDIWRALIVDVEARGCLYR